MEKIIWHLPTLKTVSEGNCSQHWKKKDDRCKQQQFFIRACFNSWEGEITLPCIVKLIRIGPRQLDSDNLQFAFKKIRDEIAECLIPEKRRSYINKKGKIVPIKGRADNDPRITWLYDQEKNPTLGIRIEIESLIPCSQGNIAHAGNL